MDKEFSPHEVCKQSFMLKDVGLKTALAALGIVLGLCTAAVGWAMHEQAATDVLSEKVSSIQLTVDKQYSVIIQKLDKMERDSK